jgi:hypothetical protein
VVPAIPVDVVNVKLAAVDWDKTTVLTGILLVDCVWVLVLDDVTFIDCLAPIPATDGSVLISEFNSCVTTD